MPFISRYALAFLLAVLFSAPLLGGCAGMPLQEMSDARQAIRAAERAGAEQHAPELLDEARGLVESARQSMHKGEYREARDDAETARSKAMEARRIAEAAQGGASSS
jgi:PBP1b-binding outer membrane lipoprotein LpoB